MGLQLNRWDLNRRVSPCWVGTGEVLSSQHPSKREIDHSYSSLAHHRLEACRKLTYRRSISQLDPFCLSYSVQGKTTTYGPPTDIQLYLSLAVALQCLRYSNRSLFVDRLAAQHAGATAHVSPRHGDLCFAVQPPRSCRLHASSPNQV